MDRPHRIWFPAKSDCKWLWDLPICWQGWMVVIGWWLALIGGVVYLSSASRAAVVIPLFVLLMSALLFGICYVKGERLRLWD